MHLLTRQPSKERVSLRPVSPKVRGCGVCEIKKQSGLRCGSCGERWLEIRKFSSVQSLSPVQLFATPWITAHQASLSITNSRSLLRLMSIKSVMPSNHLILSPSSLLDLFQLKVFSNKLALRIRWPKFWRFSFSISPSNEYSGLIFL